MNRMLLVLLALSSILSAPAAIAQTYTGNLSLASQAEVDAFSYSEVTGSLTISGADIEDLSALSVLTSVGSYLSIDNNPTLVVVDGFENLTQLGGGLFVYYNPNLISFSGFDALTATGDNVDFWYNDSLVDVAGFGSLHTAGWSLEFGGNPALTGIPAFESLQTISSSLFILDNNSLAAITGFGALQHVDWSFQINGNAALGELCGLYDYFSANDPYTGGGAFSISDNHPNLPNPTIIADVLAAGPCAAQETDVPSAVQLIDDLILEVGEMGLPRGTSNSMSKALGKAKKSLESGRVDSALNQLNDLIDDIRAQERRGKIDSATADHLADAVLVINSAINT